ncbi:MAG: hydantoinase/oxoprolinase family protein [Clostridiales bacterium]|nr:hydantoinase/oxoprolinase family protein [Clostridiales bacterium]
MIGIGIDTGGTCTDAVAYDFEKEEILASAKSSTTHEKLEKGIGESLRKLPRELVEQASYLALSTTLATNACVENRGGRVCLVFIGVSKKTLEENYESYGFDGIADMRFLDADPSKRMEPDWEAFEAMIPEILDGYDSVAVSQFLPRENNGAYEKEARRRLKERSLEREERSPGQMERSAVKIERSAMQTERRGITVVCAYEIFKDINVIKRGAGAYLNARLIPVIEEFFAAVHHVLDDMGLSFPLLIMRSDGSLVSEEYSRNYPVETLLCGPTASVKGAMHLAGEEKAVLIDMGGTTSDIALVKDGVPKTNPDGVSVGGWQTFVRGIEIDTFALGGDSHVSYHGRSLMLEPERVMPISALADQYPAVLDAVETCASRYNGSARPLYEHLLLQRSLSGKESRYTPQELKVCEALTNGPKSIGETAELLGIDVYQLDTERLEREGILLRSGFTPTDAMVLKGDRTGMAHPEEAAAAARCAAAFIAKCTGRKAEDIADEVYRLVREKLFCNLVRILWKDGHEGKRKCSVPVELESFAKDVFAVEYDGEQQGFYRNTFSTSAVLLGVGAPVHVFLDDAARALHTMAHVPAYAGVSNALGALLGDACVYETVPVHVEYEISQWDEEGEAYTVYGDRKELFDNLDDAAARAAELAESRAERKVRECGATEITSLTHQVKKKELTTNLCTILQGADVTACARGKFY